MVEMMLFALHERVLSNVTSPFAWASLFIFWRDVIGT